MKTIFLLALTITITLFVITPPGNSFAQQPALPSLAQLKAQKFTVTTLDGKRVNFNQLLGEGKPVVLDFWATWCGPCRQEIPHLKEVAKKYGKDGVIVIGLNVEDPTEDQQGVKAFVRRFGMDYQNVFAPQQIYQFLNGGRAGYRIPQTFVFGASGEPVKRLVGFSPGVGGAALTGAVERAINTGREKRQY